MSVPLKTISYHKPAINFREMGVGGDNLVLLISLIRVRDILHNQVTLFIR